MDKFKLLPEEQEIEDNIENFVPASEEEKAELKKFLMMRERINRLD